MYTIEPRGPFMLAESQGFAFIDRAAEPPGPSMRLAFCRDGSWEPRGVSLTQQRQRRGGGRRRTRTDVRSNGSWLWTSMLRPSPT